MILLPRNFPFPSTFTLRPHTPPTQPIDSRIVEDEELYQLVANFIKSKGWESRFLPKPENLKPENLKQEPVAPMVASATSDATPKLDATPKAPPRRSRRERNPQSTAPPAPKSTTKQAGKGKGKGKRKACGACGNADHSSSSNKKCKFNNAHDKSASSTEGAQMPPDANTAFATTLQTLVKEVANLKKNAPFQPASQNSPFDLGKFILKQQAITSFEKIAVAAAQQGAGKLDVNTLAKEMFAFK